MAGSLGPRIPARRQLAEVDDERWWPDPWGLRSDAHFRQTRPSIGRGRRICCSAAVLALMKMVLTAAIMSQRVTFDVLPDHPVELEATLTLRSKRRVHVIARRGEAL